MAQKQREQWVLEIRVVGETYAGNGPRSTAHMMSVVTDAIARMNNINAGVAFFEENGRRVRMTVINTLGDSSAELKKAMEVELGTDEAVGA